MRCVHGTLKKGGRGHSMAAVPHLKDGYSSGFVVTTKDPLSQKAEPSRAFRARVSFFLCLSESVAQAFRGLSSICATGTTHHLLFSRLLSSLVSFTYFSLSNLSLGPFLPPVPPSLLVCYGSTSDGSSPQRRGGLTKTRPLTVIRRPLLPFHLFLLLSTPPPRSPREGKSW